MSRIVAVAGGSGGLGRAIVDALKEDGRYETLILGRTANVELEKEIGVRILPTDYADADSVVRILEDHKIDTVITTISPANMDTAPEMKLIEAVARSKTTQRYIPSFWSAFDYKPEHAKVFPPAAGKLALQEALKKTTLEWTVIFPGFFLDYFAPKIPSYLKRAPIVVDVEGNAAAIPGSGDYPVLFTHTSDIGKFTAASLGLEKWETRYLLKGTTRTWNEVVAMAEKAKSAKFEVAYDSEKKLESGQVTWLPGNDAMLALFGGGEAKPMLQVILARLGLFMAQGLLTYDSGGYLNELFPEIKPLSMEDALANIS